MTDPLNENPEAAKARRMRNLALGGALALFVILIFVVTLIRLGSHGAQ